MAQLDPDKLFAKDDPMKLYKLLEELAVGSYGRVYRVQDKRTNNVCALKVIPLEDNDPLEDFLPEISIMKNTSHPNLVKFHGAWMKKRELFIAMELCGGGAGNDLYQSTGKSLPEPIIAFIIRETTKAISYCHENAIMHRDIKAANILFTEAGDVKLTDFGVSCQMATPLERRKTYIGTPYWVAPEIIMVNCLFKPYDNKVDIWSLGITVIELAETRPPHFNLRATRAMMEIPRAPAPKLTQPGNWSTEMTDFIARCTEKDSDKRWSAKQLLTHAWFGRACDRSVLGDYIRQIKAAKKGQAELAASGPPAPSVSSSTAAAAAAVLQSSGGSGSGSHIGLGNSNSSNSSYSASPSQSEPAFEEDAPLSAADLMPSLRRADSKLNVDDLLRPDKPVADRPVAKTRALSAQHDILVKRLQKQHIQELKKLLKDHMRAQDSSQREVDQQKPKNAAALIRKKEAVKDDETSMAKEQIGEREQLQRKQLKEMETHVRTQGLERKQLLKELRDKQSGQAAELAVYARGNEGNMKYQLELEALRLDYELALKHEAATHAVASQHLIELYALARTHYKRRKAAREEMLKKLQAIEYDHMTGEQSVQLRFLQQSHGRQRDLLELTHAKQREHMKKQQELQSALHIREFRDECAKKDREWLRSREQESKGSAEIKKALKARHEQNQREEERLCQRLMDTLNGEHRREEEDQLAQHAKMKELQIAAQKRIEAAMEKDHRDKLNALNEEHKKQKLAFLARSRKFQLDMLTEHQQGLLHALEELHRAQNNSTNEYFMHLKELKRKYALAIDFGESISQEQIEVGKKLSEAQIEEKKRAIEQGAAAVQALTEQLDQEAGELEMAISGDLLGTARARTLTAERKPQQAFSFGTARSATLNRINTGLANQTGLPPSAATGLPGALSPRGRSQTGGEMVEEYEEADYSGRTRGGTDSVLMSRDSTGALAALLQPQKYDPTAALRGPITLGRQHTTRPDSVTAPAKLEASRVTISPEEARKLAAARPKNPLYNPDAY